MGTSKKIKIIMASSMIGIGSFSNFPIAQAATTEVSEKVTTDTTEVTTKEAVASLSKLEIEGVELNKDFSADVTEYTATVENDVDKISLLVGAEAGADIKVNKKTVATSYSLKTGKNIFSIVVTNSTGSTTTYTLTVTREQNDDNSLKSLVLKKASLSEAFSSTDTAYTVAVKNGIKEITVTPTATATTSTVTIKQKVEDTWVKVSDGKVGLPVGKTTIKIIVTAENGEEKTYEVVVTRAAVASTSTTKSTSTPTSTGATKSTGTPTSTKNASTKANTAIMGQSSLTNVSASGGNQDGSSVQAVQVSSNLGSATQISNNSAEDVKEVNTATLSALKVSVGTWGKAFSTDEYTYHIALADDVSSVKISATATESDADITIEDDSETTITIGNKAKAVVSVQVEHDEDHKTYVLIFDKDIETSEEIEEADDATVTTETTDTSSSVDETKQSVGGNGGNRMQMGNPTSNSDTLWSKIKSFFSSIFN